MGFEPMLKVLQFCTVDPTIVNRFQRIVRLLSECSCDVETCEKLGKFSKNGLPLGTSKPLPTSLAEIRFPRNRRRGFLGRSTQQKICGIMLLVQNASRHLNLSVQLMQQVELPNSSQICQWRRIAHYDHSRPNSRKVLASSARSPSS